MSDTDSANRRVTKSQMKVGKYLNCDLYNESGEIVLPRGQKILKSHVEMLVPKGLYYRPGTIKKLLWSDVREEVESPFDIIKALIPRLNDLLLNGTPEQFSSDVYAMTGEIIRVCRKDTDAAVAAAILQIDAAYSARHAVQTALITSAILQRMGKSDTDMKSTLAAALTMNIAMADFQDDLQHMEGQLAPDLEMAINAHPHDGVTLLKSMGVEDRAWLTIVEQHHERIDAGGYPGKLGAADIVPGAKLVGLADRFCAKVAGRAYRKPLSAAVTIDDMAHNKTSEDLTFLSLLLEVLGNYPPGILVELANGDVAVVIQKGQDRNHPMVRTLIDKSGVVRNPELKDTGQSQYAIVKAMSPEIVNQYAMSDKIKALWGYGDLE